MLLGEGSGELRIYDNQGQGHNATMVNVTIKSLEPFVTESVYLSLQLNHTSRGHLMIKLTAPSTYNAKQQNLNYPGLLVVIHISIAFVRPSFLMSFFSLSSIHHIFYGRWEIFDSISRIPTGGSNKWIVRLLDGFIVFMRTYYLVVLLPFLFYLSRSFVFSFTYIRILIVALSLLRFRSYY